MEPKSPKKLEKALPKTDAGNNHQKVIISCVFDLRRAPRTSILVAPYNTKRGFAKINFRRSRARSDSEKS